jgi:hypothetical protein
MFLVQSQITKEITVRNRRLFTTLALSLLWVSQLVLSQTPGAAGTTAREASHHSADPFHTAFKYVVTFYPRWFTYFQAVQTNRLVGPDRISPIYHAVVAINVDTLYASASFSLTNEPVIVTIPSTSDVYSVLMLDEYGNLVQQGITAAPPGGSGAVYALIGPNWSGGTLPDGAIPIKPGVNNGAIIFRADKYVKNGNVYETCGKKQTISVGAFVSFPYRNTSRVQMPDSRRSFPS